jgi:transcriptional regulator with XRE-family HTH domain
MGSRDDPAARGRRRAARTRIDVGAGIRQARRAAGLSQIVVARRARLSQATVSRIERGVATASVDDLAGLAGVVGMDLVVQLYPGGSPIRDAAHVRVMGRLKAILPSAFRLASEVPIPIPGDQRAVDAVLVDPPLRIGFELESRLLDIQALVRRVALKQRDAGLARMALVLPDTPANRAAASTMRATLSAAFPAGHRSVLAALRTSELPPANGILWV